MKCQSETTSSSPLERHYGHYKVLIDHEDLLEVHCIMMTLPLRYGFTPKHWLKAVDVMLEKDPGDP
eukprot:4414239-Ditylum_brightwellii.AAC.2